MNNAYFSKSEVKTCMEHVSKFYSQILKEFIERLYSDNKYKHVGKISDENINQLQEVDYGLIKIAVGNLRKMDMLFNKCITMKEGSNKFEDTFKVENMGERFGNRSGELKI